MSLPDQTVPVVTTPTGREVTGPTSMGSDPRRFWHLAWTLATTEFKLRFFGSVLGYFWQLMRPLLLFAVLYAVFVGILNTGGDQPMFGVALLLGIVVFQFFADSTITSIRSLMNRENLVRKIDFPRAAIPVSCVLQAIFNFGLNLIPVFIFLFAAGGSVSVRWLELPLVLAMLIVFVTGLSLLLSALFVSFRDIEPIWEVVAQALFYGTPILYSLSVVIDKVSLTAAQIMLANPLAAAIQQLRHALVDLSYQSPGQVFGSTAGNLIPIGVSVLIFIVGALYFRRMAPLIAERL
jgi:ABC-2 type transport system permease protein